MTTKHWVAAAVVFISACGGTPPLNEIPAEDAGNKPVNKDAGESNDSGVTDSGTIEEEQDAGAGDAGIVIKPDSGTIAPVCAATKDNNALAFDGLNDHVTMGVAPKLGLKVFTLETWVRRDGEGGTYNTGVGGLTMVPIMGKGRGESDTTTQNCNYTLGFWGDVLGADFEDSAAGGNHPVTGKTSLGLGVWHHVAATYDGATWKLYVDGVLDASKATTGTPRSDSLQHFGLGTAFDTKGVAAGRLQGALREARVWNVARTQAQLRDNMFKSLTGATTGLVARWALYNALAQQKDTAGTSPGGLLGARLTPTGPVLDRGVPPLATMPAPKDQATVTGATAELSVALSDADLTDKLQVTFHLRELTDADDFTVVVLPDTQYYTVEAKGFEKYFRDQTKWIMANREKYNIVGVIHNGDIVDHGNKFAYEWTVANGAMKTLEASSPALPEGMPYGVVPGNHDQSPNGSGGGTTRYNDNFGIARFGFRSFYGGHYGANNDSNWFTFTASGKQFVVVSETFDRTPSPAVLAWGRSIFDSHPAAIGILNSHYIVDLDGTFGVQGKMLYDSVRDAKNVRLLTCGHVAGEARRSDTFGGHTIYSMLADYQGRANGGGGYLRLWEFSPANNELTVRSYSPTANKFEIDANSEFTLPMDLSGAGGPFKAVATVNGTNLSASTRLTGLKPNRRYQWFAETTDCEHTVKGPINTFKTAP